MGSIFVFKLWKKNLWRISSNTADKHDWYIQRFFTPKSIIWVHRVRNLYKWWTHVTCALLLINMPTFSEFVIEQFITRGLAFLPWTYTVDPAENIVLHSIISTRYSCATQYHRWSIYQMCNLIGLRVLKFPCHDTCYRKMASWKTRTFAFYCGFFGLKFMD